MRRLRQTTGLVALVAVAAAGALVAPRPAAAQTGRFALVIQGASGEEQYATMHRGWLDRLLTVFRDRFGYDAAHLAVLAETPRAGEERSTAAAVQAAIERLSKAVSEKDQLVVVLIGHGSGDGEDAKFNLVGRDLAVGEWAGLLKSIRGRLAVINTTSASFPFLAGLAAPDRVVVTATGSYSQRYHTAFPEGLVQAFGAPDADLDKNGRISILEAFTYASRFVKQQFEQKGTMATEVALLDDNGDGKGRDAVATGPDGSIAALTYFDAAPVQTSTDPAVQQLLTRQQALTDEVDQLRRRQATMPADEYDQAFEKLMTELAVVSREIRQKTGQ